MRVRVIHIHVVVVVVVVGGITTFIGVEELMRGKLDCVHQHVCFQRCLLLQGSGGVVCGGF